LNRPKMPPERGPIIEYGRRRRDDVFNVYLNAIDYVAWSFEKSGKAQRTIPIPLAISIPIYREPTGFIGYWRSL